MKKNIEMENDAPVLIRPYRREDRARVREISYATAFIGALPRRALQDRELVADLLTSYYTDIEPESAFVAEANGLVAGYLLGAKRTERSDREMKKLFLFRILPGLLRRKYRPGTEAVGLGLAALRSWVGDKRPPDLRRRYPAHLHVNVDERLRRHGAGALLVSAWVRRLEELEVPGVHLNTNSAQPRAASFFAECGFRTIFRAKSYFWSYLTNRTVQREVMARRVGEG